MDTVLIQAVHFKLISFLVDVWKESAFLNKLLLPHLPKSILLGASVGVNCLIRYFVLDQVRQDFWQVHLYKVRDQVPVEAVAIIDAHHPEVLDVGKVVLDDKGILISFFLAGNEALSGFDRVDLNRTGVDVNITLLFLRLSLILILFLILVL